MYYSPPSLRGQYVHRKIVDDLLKETHPVTLGLIPWPYEVHHADWNKEHNEASNFILLGNSLHSAITCYGTHYRGKFRPKWKSAPEWVLFREDIESVPF